MPVSRDPGTPATTAGVQSDKYPTCPRGKVPLSTKDPMAQDLLWEYAQRRRSVDAQFADDLEEALRGKGYVQGAITAIPLSDEQRALLDAAMRKVRAEADGFVPWPDGAPRRYNACTDPCDMLIGPCACGATHTTEELARAWAERDTLREAFDKYASHFPDCPGFAGGHVYHVVGCTCGLDETRKKLEGMR